MIDSTSGDGFKVVYVRKPCKCEAKRWFDCRCHNVEVASYEVTVRDTVPMREQLAYIESQHPGMTLIY